MSGITMTNGASPVAERSANNSHNNTHNAGVLPLPGGAVELTESSGRALKLQTDAPHLVSMGGDRLSTAVTLHPLPQGRVTLGSGSGVDIPVQGTGVLPLHCHIENSEGVVTIYPIASNLSIDGVLISSPTRLRQGVMLTIGRSNYMRFNHPAEAKLMKLTNTRISMAPITFESEDAYQLPKYAKKPPTVPRKSPRSSLSDEESPMQSSIMMKVSKFEYLAAQNFKQSISPKVFSANLVTVNTPAKDVLGRAPPDLHHFTKNISQPAVNYAETNFKNKTPDRQVFGSKSPSYVNVQLNETKSINNRVCIFENGAKEVNHHELNNITRNYNYNMNSGYGNKNVNVAKCQGKPQQENKNNLSSYEDLSARKQDAELKRNQAHADRIKEQQIEKAEQARLDEILNMCAEYDKQQSDKSNKTPNRIKTNGSLPRDKRQCISPNLLNSPKLGTSPGSGGTSESSIFKFESQDSLITGQNLQQQYEIHEAHKTASEVKNMSGYENVTIANGVPSFQLSSPRTRIKTFVSPSNSALREIHTESHSEISVILPKFKDERGYIRHLENYENLTLNNHNGSISNNLNRSQIDRMKDTSISEISESEQTKKICELKEEKRDKLSKIATLKRRMAEMDNMGEELSRELDLERSLILGECKSKQLELEKLQSRKDTLIAEAHVIDDKMNETQVLQEEDQKTCKLKLEQAQELVAEIEKKLEELNKDSDHYNTTFEEYLVAQESLDNQNKKFEDMEFHQLEEEADLLASREEKQREILDLSKRIDELQIQIDELQHENSLTITSNAEQYTKIEEKRLECYQFLEEVRAKLRLIDAELSNLREKETDDDISTDSESEKPKDLETIKREVSLLSLNNVCDLSTSFIVSSTKICEEDFNMSQSFNEKMLHEKSILEDGLGKRIPSQDDIDRISKVTINAPMNIDDNRGSLGKKALESLKEIERNRHLHLEQQGTHVIEIERRRVLALKQKVQNEVRTKWAADRKHDGSSIDSLGSDDTQNGNLDTESTTLSEEVNSNHIQTSAMLQPRENSSTPDSPRPLSETSDVSVEIGTIGRRRGKNLSDKHRPLTRYLPIRSTELDLRHHIESAGHQADLCPHVRINTTSCRGFLLKRGSKLNGWSRRWFVFDRQKRTLVYYSDKSEKKPRGGAYFQAIEEVYLDHANSVKSPNPQLTFIVKTHERYYYLMAPSPEAMRIWIDVIFTGAEGYQEFEHGT